MAGEEVKQEIRKLIAEIIGRDEGEISDEANYIIGQVIQIDGGLAM